ncbi:MAG: polysulfide reductase NrfD [Chloroflexi bacterium]|nr:polysulfide reductase NrfD [Chloroflexota bacterium]
MIQSRRYEYLVQHTPQREWIEKRGILMWLAMFFIELGAGAFMVSSFFGNFPGMLLGWLLCGVLGGGFHLVYLGHPVRFWRMVLSSGWKTSWISRGLIFVVLFLGLGLLHMALLQLAVPVPGILIAADVFAFLTIIYVGFVMASVSGIPLWNTALLPVLYLILGSWGGLGLTLLTLLASGATTEAVTVEEWSRIFLLAFVFIVFVYLFSTRYQGATGKASVRAIVAGKLSPLFWTVVAFLGTALPVGVALATWILGWSIPGALVFVLIVFELLGDLTLRYCILRAGLYAPLIPGTSYG